MAGRLIDADALHSNFFDYSPREMVWDRGDVEHKINEMPTIDAIPVEWIENMLKEWLKSSASFETCGAISAMLHMWQKEQEANHVETD